MLFTLFKLSFQTLTANKFRTFLTIVGVVIGTATVIIVLSVGEGVKGFIMSQLSTITPESLYVEVQVPSKGTRDEKSAQTGTAIATGVQITTMKAKDVEDVRSLSNIISAYGYATGQEKVTYGNKEKKPFMYAVEYTYPRLEGDQIEKGRFFTEQEDQGLARVVVIGSAIRENLFGTEDPLGRNIKIKQINFKVIGVMKPLGTMMFMNMDEIIYVPLHTAQKLLLGFDYIIAFASKMKDKTQIVQTMWEIERVLRRNHNIKDPAKDDFVIRTQDEAMEIVNTVTDGISLLLFSIAAISLLVGGIGIMNVMYVTVTERTREIGLRKAIGAKPAVILMQFLLEAVIVTILGGIIGIAVGLFISWGISQIAQLLNFAWQFYLPVQGIIVSFSISAAFGIIFGYAPARRAARLHPIDALRYE